MDINRTQIEAWAAKMKDGSISDAEQALFNAWINEQMAKDTYAFDPSFAADEESLKQRILEKLHARLEAGQEEPQAAIVPYGAKIPRYRWISAAAAVLLLAVCYFWQPSWVNSKPADIAPGYNQATLTLADGTKINLDSAKSGIQINDKDIHYNDGTKINAPIHHSSSITYNSLTTPRGGQYQIILSDGTKVWLNAASTLKYPSKFTGDKREVSLEGEGFFEIKEDKTKPFKVLSKNQEILVLGTSFNINTYDPDVKTTLVTGAVRIQNSAGVPITLGMPGEQSITQSNGNLTKAQVDVNRELAWKNGAFDFTGKNLEQVMKELSRWYNIDVVYENQQIPNMTFVGTMSRNNNLSQVLEILESTKVKFRVEGRKLIINHQSEKK